ncbi:hypothetical protein OAU25_02245 [Crocinitomicaceae bacterium]|nr:hypothetical protein [Crocinitomicaceae bacterium]
MKKTIYSILAFALLLTTVSCSGGNPSGHADEMCDCLKEGGFDNSISLMDLEDLEDSFEGEVPACMLSVFRKIEDDMADMSKNDKKEYTKDFLKGVVDTECSDIILDVIPYDMFGLALTGAETELLRNF